MLLEKAKLFNTKKEFGFFLLGCLFILSYALLIEYNNYTNLTKFDSAIIEARVLKQYQKTKATKTYQVLKLQAKKGFTFYTSQRKSFPQSIDKTLTLEINTSHINFYQYMSSFYAHSKVLHSDNNPTLKEKLDNYLDTVHQNKQISSIYKALYTATPLPKNLQNIFSQLGVSHLLAISGFHLGVLATLLFFLFKLPYRFLQDRYFPYRNYKIDSFVSISLILFAYLIFLDTPPSLLRAYTMMLIGFFLYDRGYKIISMQTLVLSAVILLAFFPRLLFSLGFWLSIAGVFYIFLFLIYFKNLSKIAQFLLLPFWVYLMMLPYSLTIFANFSLYHPLSILWSMLFGVFYPLSILGHILGQGEIFDTLLDALIHLPKNSTQVDIGFAYLTLFMVISFLAIYKRYALYLLIFLSISSLIYAVEKV